eukprot:scaffold72825_cov15-Tisochrysis_lutea.AAC.1
MPSSAGTSTIPCFCVAGPTPPLSMPCTLCWVAVLVAPAAGRRPAVRAVPALLLLAGHDTCNAACRPDRCGKVPSVLCSWSPWSGL